MGVRHLTKLGEKDEQIEALESDLAGLRVQIQEVGDSTDELRRQGDVARSEVHRVREESQQKINALNERIKELNLHIQDGGKGPSSGFFKR